jgi:exodeoxyribonuclease VII small subunit
MAQPARSSIRREPDLCRQGPTVQSGRDPGLTGQGSLRYFCRLVSTARMSKSSSAPLPKTFEGALAELETIVDSMESGQLALEQSIAAYRRGAQLLEYCQATLNEASQQVKVLEAGLLKDLSIDGEPAVADSGD